MDSICLQKSLHVPSSLTQAEGCRGWLHWALLNIVDEGIPGTWKYPCDGISYRVILICITSTIVFLAQPCTCACQVLLLPSNMEHNSYTPVGIMRRNSVGGGLSGGKKTGTPARQISESPVLLRHSPRRLSWIREAELGFTVQALCPAAEQAPTTHKYNGGSRQTCHRRPRSTCSHLAYEYRTRTHTSTCTR